MSRRVLRMLLLCAGLFVVAPASAPAAVFGLAADLPQALDAPVTQVRGGWHWRRFWRNYRRRHRLHRHRHHRHWHHHRHAGHAHGRLRFETGRGRSGRESGPAQPPPRSPSREGSRPKLF